MDMIWILIPLLALSIPIIAIVSATVFTPWLKLKERRMELEAQMTAEKAAQYATKTERLEQRMRVLERIVTDKGIDLSEEIDRLRDTPVN
ncbi:MAG TPA: hypothetical protein VGF77_01345 [Allosphingosinicella sp.]|jgi:uncharacterized protein YpmS